MKFTELKAREREFLPSSMWPWANSDDVVAANGIFDQSSSGWVLDMISSARVLY